MIDKYPTAGYFEILIRRYHLFILLGQEVTFRIAVMDYVVMGINDNIGIDFRFASGYLCKSPLLDKKFSKYFVNCLPDVPGLWNRFEIPCFVRHSDCVYGMPLMTKCIEILQVSRSLLFNYKTPRSELMVLFINTLHSDDSALVTRPNISNYLIQFRFDIKKK